jgi:excisionase family DNA binding protein
MHVGEPLLVTTTEAARLLRVSRVMVYNLMATGHLASVKIGRARRVPRAEVERLAREGTDAGR